MSADETELLLALRAQVDQLGEIVEFYESGCSTRLWRALIRQQLLYMERLADDLAGPAPVPRRRHHDHPIMRVVRPPHGEGT